MLPSACLGAQLVSAPLASSDIAWEVVSVHIRSALEHLSGFWNEVVLFQDIMHSEVSQKAWLLSSVQLPSPILSLSVTSNSERLFI